MKRSRNFNLGEFISSHKNVIIIVCTIIIVTCIIGIGVGNYLSRAKEVKEEVETVNTEIETYKPVEIDTDASFIVPVKVVTDSTVLTYSNVPTKSMLAVYNKGKNELIGIFNIVGTQTQNNFNIQIRNNIDVDFSSEESFMKIKNNPELYTMKILIVPQLEETKTENMKVLNVTHFSFFDYIEK